MPTDIDTLKGNYVEQNLGTIIQNIISEPKNALPITETVHNLTSLTTKVYGRVDEAKILDDALCGRADYAAKRFFLVVAPSGFGKSYLLTKTLQNVTDGTNIKPDYEPFVRRIIRLDCRNTKTVADIVSEFTNIIGFSFGYPADFGHPYEYLNGVLFYYLRNVGKLWLILDNFEAWLDGENDYQPISDEVRAFLAALFKGNHSMRGVFLTQSALHFEADEHFEILEEASRKIAAGLPMPDALEMLRTNGAKVGLDKVAEADLIKFVAKTAHIPQAITSLIGYLNTKKNTPGGTFQSVLNDFANFDEHEQKDGESHTKYLIARQINAQSEKVKLLLQAITYFERAVPHDALSILCDDEDIARLVSHNLVTMEIRQQETFYYDLHSYFREQTKKVLFDFSRIVNTEYADALLYKKGEENRISGFLVKAVDLYECAEKIYRELFNKGRTDLENYISSAKNNKGIAFISQGRFDEAITNYDDSIKILERLVNELNQDKFANNLAAAYLNKGSAFYYQGKLDEAITNYDNSIKIRERLVYELKQDRFVSYLALSYWGKGVARASQGKLDEAITNYDDSLKILKRLVNELKQDKFASNLAMTYMNKGSTLHHQGKLDEAIESYENAINIYERLVNELLQDQFADDLATIYMNKGITLYAQGKFDEAVESFDNSEKARECWLQRGHYQVLPGFIKNIRSRIETLLKLKDWRRTASDVITAFDFEGRWREIELSAYFIEQIKERRDAIIRMLRKVSAKKRKEIYRHAGEFGEEVKELVENFEEDEKKS
jgi:tetratricopeptide (TPR) repeat protein